jgi:transcriptional regulator with GAF, ATPase, and Fis domain
LFKFLAPGLLFASPERRAGGQGGTMRAFEFVNAGAAGTVEEEAIPAPTTTTVVAGETEAEIPGFAGIIGRHRRMQAVFDVIRRVAGTNATVLITGESGTGKELVAQAIHTRSRRRLQRLVPVHCGAIPEDLLESEMFGHERGAFTGAICSRVGRFRLADGGTIFLDEIGDMSPKLQVKLLRVLENGMFEPVSSTRSAT